MYIIKIELINQVQSYEFWFTIQLDFHKVRPSLEDRKGGNVKGGEVPGGGSKGGGDKKGG